MSDSGAPIPNDSDPTSRGGTTTKSRTPSRANIVKSSSRAASRVSLRAGASGVDLRPGSNADRDLGKRAKSKASIRGAAESEDEGAGTGGNGAGGEDTGATTAGPANPPAGIFPLFLTTMTQDLFKVRVGEDVTAEKPIKMIPKADILSDLQARLAIGDFYPAKQAILDFPGEEFLLHYDAEFKYGQNFYLCVDMDAMDAILRPVMEEVPPDTAAEVKRPASRKKWESLGSEKEVESDWVVKNRDLINVRVSRRRRHFGARCKFGDRDAHDGFLECRPFKDPNYDISRMEISEGVQAVPSLVEAAVQTAWFRPLNFAVQYEPITMSSQEKDAIMQSDEIEDFVQAVSIRFEKALQQNSIVNIFQDDYQELGEEDVTLEQGPHTYLQEYQSFTDLKHSKDRCISCVDWHPTIKGVVAISCTERMTFDERVEKGLFFKSRKSLILVWSFHDPIHPQLILEAPEDVQCFQFNPHDPSIIAGGCINGQIVLWDISEYTDKLKTSRKPGRSDTSTDEDVNSLSGTEERERVTDTSVLHWVAVSSIEFSHRSGITDIQWLPRNMELSHTGEILEKGEHGHRELVTTSVDGQVAFWDTRYKKDFKALDLVWRPFLRVPLSAMDNTFDYSLTKISIRRVLADKGTATTDPTQSDALTEVKPETFSSKFFCSTEEGDLIYADWVAEKASEEKASRVEHAFSYHFGPMSDLHRSPFFPDILLSVGGWSCHIWREGVTGGSLLSSAPTSSYVICGRWSPTRPGVFYISKADGTIEVWDLLDRSHSASSVQNISGSAISYLAVRQYPGKSLTHNQFIAAGDDEGTLHILEVPRNLTKPSKNEKAFVRAFFDREVRRLGYVRGRKEYRIKEQARYEQIALEAAAAKGAKKEAEAAVAPTSAGAGPPGSAHSKSTVGGNIMMSEEEEEKAEQEYLKMEHNFLELEGLLPPAAT
ncbi:uncharacterized protein SPPG_01562 [Spizellomyces punctatus DAOM BR117]|uniref:WD repeat-containing protein 63 n=1 Tax=Spizellomyces punctatus (strain DAOM BR117) TaxID=645134 RepID=A0A0L0HTD3_SPIPD|nr:uncharacterized protein SPPG_01562 [Spizellomyces punctatus DAOM BR117]KND04124.1 hypothetical protein SPPG_01562 [Spizellomyces punctatus DAOM BR117]|eukprot:XP_016612163.1 hypothetical protein SPPG_01562 [Spizellomyces punctatus DAOM BR117]